MTAPKTTSTTATPSTEIDAGSSSGSTLVSSQGRTVVADTVVSKIAGIATREVTGVYAVGGGASRVVGALRERIVEVGEKQAAVDLDIVAEYGVSITDLASGIRRNVIAAIERMTGLEVTEVNITVHDVHLDDEESNNDTGEEPKPSRVQ
jgi:uncharacterized alkaline shock family protein YloU